MRDEEDISSDEEDVSSFTFSWGMMMLLLFGSCDGIGGDEIFIDVFICIFFIIRFINPVCVCNKVSIAAFQIFCFSA